MAVALVIATGSEVMQKREREKVFIVVILAMYLLPGTSCVREDPDPELRSHQIDLAETPTEFDGISNIHYVEPPILVEPRPVLEARDAAYFDSQLDSYEAALLVASKVGPWLETLKARAKGPLSAAIVSPLLAMKIPSEDNWYVTAWNVEALLSGPELPEELTIHQWSPRGERIPKGHGLLAANDGETYFVMLESIDGQYRLIDDGTGHSSHMKLEGTLFRHGSRKATFEELVLLTGEW